jgi:hypothetical protein
MSPYFEVEAEEIKDTTEVFKPKFRINVRKWTVQADNEQEVRDAWDEAVEEGVNGTKGYRLTNIKEL